VVGAIWGTVRPILASSNGIRRHPLVIMPIFEVIPRNPIDFRGATASRQRPMMGHPLPAMELFWREGGLERGGGVGHLWGEGGYPPPSGPDEFDL
jgi:hypothetical protein